MEVPWMEIGIGSKDRTMGPLFRVLFAVSLAVLIAQGAHSRIQYGADGEPEKTDKTEDASTALTTVAEDSLSQKVSATAAPELDHPSELQVIDDTTKEIVTEMEQRVSKAKEYVQQVNQWIGWAYSVGTVKKAVKRSLKMGRRDIAQARFQVRNILCDRYDNFKIITDSSTPADPELVEAVKTLESPEAPLNPVFTGLKEHNKRLLRRQKSQEPHTLNEWKEYFMKVSKESMDSYTEEMTQIEKSAQSSLNTLYNALVIWQDANRDLKGGQEKPTNVEEKLALIRPAMKLGEQLGCAPSQQSPKLEGPTSRRNA
ncbi:unnamed protein product [Bemisia tabaci]|uniref:Uncharacterized protein n=1 Tax=Bemisia tabaci TaxID=7038 RepID=A0A9P0ACS9_BEMTA|nr:unnamed protein product [Bemisia tabaci]